MEPHLLRKALKVSISLGFSLELYAGLLFTRKLTIINVF